MQNGALKQAQTSTHGPTQARTRPPPMGPREHAPAGRAQPDRLLSERLRADTKPVIEVWSYPPETPKSRYFKNRVDMRQVWRAEQPDRRNAELEEAPAYDRVATGRFRGVPCRGYPPGASSNGSNCWCCSCSSRLSASPMTSFNPASTRSSLVKRNRVRKRIITPRNHCSSSCQSIRDTARPRR